ncbi:MAG: serine/threonine protein phosphatase [Coleofasciculaceae cyanobacterium SM2_1_6]|nr:serine/threonine protein phosphatase [Coleofasciculaceae cyanobacterium SM2_1_6]
MLNCPNVRCQAVNKLDGNFCQVCGTPLLRRYLWMLGVTMTPQRIGETIDSRYLVVQPRLLLDTKPATTPETPEDFPPEIGNYLQLFSQRLHIPQVYGLVRDTGLNAVPIWLLEGVPMIGDRLAPELSTVWSGTSPLRQLSWLRQIAHLWEPLQSRSLSATLVSPELLRVHGSLVKLLQLQSNRHPLSLADLGQHWLTLVQPQSSIAGFLEELGVRMITGAISNTSQLLAVLDWAIEECSQQVSHQYQVLTSTDKGPTRGGNEDDCYPAAGQITTLGKNLLTIVCDGIGGHEGGEVASHLAISTIQRQVEQFDLQIKYPSAVIEQKLIKAVRVANDVISDRNDREQRQSRQRMGTTLVMAWSYAHELYFSNVGDSRAYWITPTSCEQITLDDDIASREVGLGYALYREALKYPSSGSLVQALGMTSAVNLHPAVQRLLLDESGIILLCSDGLSDYDRVEQYWEKLIAPILRGETNLETVVPQLIELANTQNGHDNVTVALIHCQVIPHKKPISPLSFPKVLPPVVTPQAPDSLPAATPASPSSLSALSSAPSLNSVSAPAPGSSEEPVLSNQKTVPLPKKKQSIWPGLLLVAVLGGVGLWIVDRLELIDLGSIWAVLPFAQSSEVVSSPIPKPSILSNSSPNTTATPTPRSPSLVLTLNLGDRLRLSSPLLLPLTGNPTQRVDLPPNTVLQVVKQTTSPNQGKLVELAVCLMPIVPLSSSSPNPPRPSPTTQSPLANSSSPVTPPVSLTNSPNPANNPANQIGNVTVAEQSLAIVTDPNYPRTATTVLGKCPRN